MEKKPDQNELDDGSTIDELQLRAKSLSSVISSIVPVNAFVFDHVIDF